MKEQKKMNEQVGTTRLFQYVKSQFRRNSDLRLTFSKFGWLSLKPYKKHINRRVSANGANNFQGSGALERFAMNQREADQQKKAVKSFLDKWFK